MRPLAFLSLLLVACSAPEIADLPSDVTPPPNVPPDPPSERPQPTPSPAELAGRAAAPTPPSAAPPPEKKAPPQKLVATPEDTLGPPPYTAWTTHAPLTPVGPGGVAVAHIKRLGVRIDVVQVLDHRTRFTCTGCTGESEGAEAWLQPGRLRAAGSGGSPEDPLVVALQIRARWAGGTDLPEGATPGQMCALVDAGFTLPSPGTAVWQSDGGRLELTWSDGRWSIASVKAPRGSTNCRTQKARPA